MRGLESATRSAPPGFRTGARGPIWPASDEPGGRRTRIPWRTRNPPPPARYRGMPATGGRGFVRMGEFMVCGADLPKRGRLVAVIVRNPPSDRVSEGVRNPGRKRIPGWPVRRVLGIRSSPAESWWRIRRSLAVPAHLNFLENINNINVNSWDLKSRLFQRPTSGSSESKPPGTWGQLRYLGGDLC